MKRYACLLLLFCLLKTNPAGASTLTVIQNLSFGTLIPTSSSGQVLISTAGALSSSSGTVTVAPSGTAYYQGIVRLTPTVLDVFTVSITNSTIILTNSTPGGGTVTIDNINNNPQTINITLLSPVNINVGGRMTFTSASKGGTYTGMVQVQVRRLLGETLSVNLPITLTFWNSLSMAQITPLSFGELQVTGGTSVIRLAPATGQRSIVSGAGNVTLGSNPAATAGRFDISGQANANINITLPSSITLTGNNGGSMTVNNFTGSPSSTSTVLDASGSKTLLIGADLNIGTAQPSGTYSGTYSLTVNY